MMIPFHVIYEVYLEISKLEGKVKEVDGKWVTRIPQAHRRYNVQRHQVDHTPG